MCYKELTGEPEPEQLLQPEEAELWRQPAPNTSHATTDANCGESISGY